jgi:hypothetical protein
MQTTTSACGENRTRQEEEAEQAETRMLLAGMQDEEPAPLPNSAGKRRGRASGKQTARKTRRYGGRIAAQRQEDDAEPEEDAAACQAKQVDRNLADPTSTAHAGQQEADQLVAATHETPLPSVDTSTVLQGEKEEKFPASAPVRRSQEEDEGGRTGATHTTSLTRGDVTPAARRPFQNRQRTEEVASKQPCDPPAGHRSPGVAQVLVPETLLPEDAEDHDSPRAAGHEGVQHSQSSAAAHAANAGRSINLHGDGDTREEYAAAAAASRAPQHDGDETCAGGLGTHRGDYVPESLYLVDFGSAPVVLPTLTMSLGMQETQHVLCEKEQRAASDNGQSQSDRCLGMDEETVRQANASTMRGLLVARIQGGAALGDRRASDCSTTTRGSAEGQRGDALMTCTSSARDGVRDTGCDARRSGDGAQAVISPNAEIREQDDAASAAHTSHINDPELKKRKRQREWDWSETLPSAPGTHVSAVPQGIRTAKQENPALTFLFGINLFAYIRKCLLPTCRHCANCCLLYSPPSPSLSLRSLCRIILLQFHSTYKVRSTCIRVISGRSSEA